MEKVYSVYSAAKRLYLRVPVKPGAVPRWVAQADRSAFRERASADEWAYVVGGEVFCDGGQWDKEEVAHEDLIAGLVR